MEIKLSKNYTGLNRNIIYNLNTNNISTENRNIFWQNDNIRHLINYLNVNCNSLNDEYSKLIKSLKINGEVNWSSLLGKDFVQQRFKSLIRQIENSERLNDYVKIILPKRIALFNRLQPFIYKEELRQPLLYDHNKTVTGRTVISKGLNLMTIKKEDRKMLKSKYHNGAIIEIDIKSLEPRLYLSLIKGIDVEDAYSFLSEEVLKCDESISRKDIKLAFISLLYGASQSKIKKITALKSSDIKKIRDYLEVSQFKNKIEKEFNEKGHFENAYGRKIYSINAPVNYYIQSTAADFSCLLYENLMQKIPNDIDLIGVIHDAIILDCQPVYINSLMKVKYCVEDIINRKAYFSVNRHS